MQADSVGAKTEIDNLKIQLRKLQEKLSEVISRVSSLEGDLVPSHVDGLTEDQCHDHVNTSDALKSSGKSFELSVSSSTAQRNLNGDRHLVGTAYCSRLVTLPREYEHQNLLHDLSLRPENGCLVVEKSEPSTLTSLVKEGDSIISVNGMPVSTEDELKTQLQSAEGVTLEVVPSALRTVPLAAEEVYVKCLYDYDPSVDQRLEQKQSGLPFKIGDILQVNGHLEDDWWQARKVDDWAANGLIPSVKLQKSTYATEGGKCEKLSHGGISGDASGFLHHKIVNGLTLLHRRSTRDSEKNIGITSMFYEELVQSSPYGRKVIMLVGARGVGRRTIKSHLLHHDPDDFATIVPFTSRRPREGEREGREYHFTTHHQIKEEIARDKFLEYGELNGNLYGTKIDSVREVIRKGQVCVIDCNPEALKVLRNREFMPFVVFIEPPPLEEFKQIYAIHREILTPRKDDELLQICQESDAIKQGYRHYFDLILVNRNTEVTFRSFPAMAETQAEENAKDEHGQQPSADDSEQSQLSESSDLVTQLTKIQPLLPPIVSSADCGSQSASALSNELIKMGAITPFVLPTNPSEGTLPIPQVRNIIATVNMGCKLDLKKITLSVRNAEYNPARFAAVILRIRDPRTTALVFSSGKLVCIGAKTEDMCSLACRKYVRIMQKLNFEAKFRDFKIQNMVASFDMRFPVHLERLCVAHAQFCTYEPELFAGLVYRMVHPRVVLLIFVSGKGVIMGAKERKDFDEAFTNISPILNGFRKQ